MVKKNFLSFEFFKFSKSANLTAQPVPILKMSAKNIFKAVAFYFLITILVQNFILCIPYFFNFSNFQVIGVSIAFGSLYIKEYFSDVKVKSLEKTSNVFVFFGFFVIFVSIFGLYGLFKGVKWILISVSLKM